MKLLRNIWRLIYDVSLSARLWQAIVVILVISQVVAGVAIADDVTSEQYVLVRRVIDTRYGATAKANAQLDSLLSSKIERIYAVKPKDNIQTIVSKLFGIGPTATPAEYQKLERHVIERNGLASADGISVGQHLVLPDLPPKQYKKPNPSNPFYGQPRVSMGPSLAEIKARQAASLIEKFAVTESAKITDKYRKASPYVVQWRWVPESIAKQEVSNSSEALITSPMSGDIFIHFEDQAHTSDPVEEIQPDVDYLKALLARKQPEHQIVLFVFDDAWPDQTTFLQSRDFFVDAGNQIRNYFSLGTPDWDGNLRAQNIETSFPFDQAGRGGCHSRSVSASLNPFTGISSKVKVVYIPLFLEQKWSSELWHEILLMTNAAYGKQDSPEEPQSDIIDTARKFADELIQKFPKVVTRDPTRTDLSAVTSILKFADLYARSTGHPFFISMSWTIPKYTFDFGPDPDTMGLSVVAAGNNTKDDIMKTKVLLAYRAKEFPGDVLAVMNVHPDGATNCSSSWGNTANQDVYGLAYSGFIPGDCGTSYSTPRVAWLLALREAYNDPVNTDADASQTWFSSYRRYLLSLQDKQKAGPLRYWLSPAKLFGGL